MKDFLKADRWLQRELGDFELCDAVERSIDLTVQKLGRRNFGQTDLLILINKDTGIINHRQLIKIL